MILETLSRAASCVAVRARPNRSMRSPDPMRYGRGVLNDWKKIGYLTIGGTDRSGSKQMEYAADDFEVALVAKGLGRDADYTKYLGRSKNWSNLWDGDFKEGGIRAFIRTRHRDGQWKKNFNAMQSCSWGAIPFTKAIHGPIPCLFRTT